MKVRETRTYDELQVRFVEGSCDTNVGINTKLGNLHKTLGSCPHEPNPIQSWPHEPNHPDWFWRGIFVIDAGARLQRVTVVTFSFL